MATQKFDLLQKLNSLTDLAVHGEDSFPNELCDFLANVFELNAVVLLRLTENDSLSVIGKSSSVRRNVNLLSTFKCSSCKNLSESRSHRISSDENCEIQISDFLMNESCCLITVAQNEKVLLKFGSQNPLKPNEKDLIEKTIPLLSSIFQVWLEGKGGSIKSPFSIAKIVQVTSVELKTSSNSIMGLLSKIANEKLTVPQTELISAIKKNTQNILLNINDLNELAKIEANNLSKNVKQTDIVQLANEIIELFKSRFGNTISFSISADKILKKPIEIDDQKLRYILTSLLFVSTALTGKGKITLNISPEPDNKIGFSISDNGKSLSGKISGDIFEPFAIAKVDELKNSAITGLCLSIVKQYVNYLGGAITAETSVEKGNSFTFTISGEVMSVLENSIAQLPKPTSKNKVLVIEDDYATSKLLSNYLNKWGYDPTIVNSAEQALNLIDKEKMLAIILDIELPNVNGLELLKKIHEHPNAKNSPVIVCSVEPEQQKAFMMGAVEYFIKPINYNYLVEVLTSYKLRKNSNVLCVDDDLPTLNLVRQAIEAAGFVALAEHVSANVMDLIRNKDIDLAIVDLDMPAPNGFELIKLIKAEKRFANLPIIIYTGKENYQEDLKNIEGLFEELLDKRSTNIEDLADTINAMINRYETPPPVDEVMHRDNVIKVLLAEDYKHSQIIVTRLLKKNGFENVVVVENGEDAVKMAQQEHFNLILMDMQMPIMNGFEATEKIREMPSYKDVPVIALTAFAMKGDREKCLEAGATDYIPKPIDSKEFIEKVKYYTNTLP